MRGGEASVCGGWVGGVQLKVCRRFKELGFLEGRWYFKESGRRRAGSSVRLRAVAYGSNVHWCPFPLI